MDDLRDALSIEASEKRLAELEHQMTMPGFYDDPARSQKAVSYTHLDVYKRQVGSGLDRSAGCVRQTAA